jgi:putative toxin-antitoxin system antitoxin component (TIGR02293 family)
MPRKHRAVPASHVASRVTSAAATPADSTILDELADDVSLVPEMRVRPEALVGLARHGYSDSEISALVIPKRTLARRHARREPLTVEETDRALRLARVAKLAQRVFGNPEKAHRWLRKPKRALKGATPVQFLASEASARVVEGMLYRIQHGIFA